MARKRETDSAWSANVRARLQVANTLLLDTRRLIMRDVVAGVVSTTAADAVTAQLMKTAMLLGRAIACVPQPTAAQERAHAKAS
jgi:hypothetical protein